MLSDKLFVLGFAGQQENHAFSKEKAADKKIDLLRYNYILSFRVNANTKNRLS